MSVSLYIAIKKATAQILMQFLPIDKVIAEKGFRI